MSSLYDRGACALLSLFASALLCGCPKGTETPHGIVEGPRSGMGDVRVAAFAKKRAKADGASPLLATRAPEPPTEGESPETGRFQACYELYEAVGAVTMQGSLACSGTLIGPKTVLTSAHCVSGEAKDLGFAVGCWLQNAIELIPVTRAIQHDKYVFDEKKPRAEHDLAILCLDRASSARPISLPPAALNDPDLGHSRPAFVGYGYADFMDAPYIGVRRRLGLRIRLPVADFSFEFGNEDPDTCVYDSGGPALLYREAGPQIVGVTSYSESACRGESSSARVDKEREWILDVMAKQCKDEPPVTGSADGRRAPDAPRAARDVKESAGD